MVGTKVKKQSAFSVEALKVLILNNSEWLVGRILDYANKFEYVKYTSTLEEAWRNSIAGLSETLIRAIHFYHDVPELYPDENYRNDPIARFAILEAQRQRKRGVSLPMYLGIMKYYKQSYLDLITGSNLKSKEIEKSSLFIERCFDRIEIGFCTEWTGLKEIEKLVELQQTNQTMTHEKNKYLTIFESLHTPVIILNRENRTESLNEAAARLIEIAYVPGSSYYGDKSELIIPWLNDEARDFVRLDSTEQRLEKEILTSEGVRYFSIVLKKLRDAENRFSGTALIFEDLTEQKKMENKLQIMATTDSLTGVYNRRWYLELTSKEINRARRHKLPLSLIMADIDHLKRLNDAWGHHTGDIVLKSFSGLLKKLLRDHDIMGRLGGEEFGITLIKSDLRMAALTADRLRHAVSGSSITVDEKKIRFTISLGVAQFGNGDRDVHSFIKRADNALYSAKNNGRNCVKVAR
jgi:diguanylate cyclase (GGDEF)-like protein